MRALLSVYDKTGIAEFAKELHELEVELVSSGGTAKAIAAAGIPVKDVADVTGLPAILGHRVVTLHPKVHGGILAIPDDAEHQSDMKAHGIEAFDIVVANLYPFSSDPSIDLIDIGGPAMVRGAAKNHAYVAVLTDPADYPAVLAEIKSDGTTALETRKRLARKAFAHTAEYDAAIVEWLDGDEALPDSIHLTLKRTGGALKYGENAWQTPAGGYSTHDDTLALHSFASVEGDLPSYNNSVDVHRLMQTMTHLAAGHATNFKSVPLVAIGVKHGNACGVAVGNDPVEVVKKMVTGDRQAIFGGLVMLNFPIDEKVADALLRYEKGEAPRRLLDGIMAPDFDEKAIEMLGRKGGKCRLLHNPALAKLTADSLDKKPLLRQVRGGFLKQPNYGMVLNLSKAEVATGELIEQQRRDLVTAWAICATSNSNTITLVRNGQLIGNGVGQQDRVGAALLAISRARGVGSQHDTKGAVACSDSFFPFSDGPKVLCEAGVSAIFATNGSVRDADTVEVCKEQGVALCWLPDSEARMFFGH